MQSISALHYSLCKKNTRVKCEVTHTFLAFILHVLLVGKQLATAYSFIRFKALHGGLLISFRFAVTPCAYLSYR